MAGIKDVAERAGVSSATVSRVLNEDPNVASDKRQRVVDAARELGYRPNQAARNLRRKSTETIGVIVSDISNLHFAQAVGVIENIAYGRGYRVVLCTTDESVEKQRAYLEVLMAEQVQGIIIAPADPADPTITSVLNHNIPVVAFDRHVLDPRADAVVANNVAAVKMATEHLLELGHRHIGFVTGRTDVQTGADRLAGYLQAMTEAGLPPIQTTGGFQINMATNATMDLLNAHPHMSALIVANNVMTIGAMRALAATGRQIPQDIALIGIDDPFWAEFTNPALTVLAQPVKEMAAAALDLLFERIKRTRTQPANLTFDFELRIRESTGALPIQVSKDVLSR